MIERGLIIQGKWLDLILDNGKVWEMRSSRTKIRGQIALIESGTGLIVGEAELIGCGEALSRDEAVAAYQSHKVFNIDLLEKWKYPWILKNAKRYDKPKPYDHPQGAVIWVRL